MEPQISNSAIVSKVIDHIGNFPAKLSQIQLAVKKARIVQPILISLREQELLQKMYKQNNKMIQYQFFNMMSQVLKKIEPQIIKYPQYKSIKYLQSIIYEHLDPVIFQSVRISRIRNQKLGTSFQDQNLTIADRLFTELITIMGELLQIMKKYYGLPRDEKIQGVLFEIIHIFVCENKNCFLVLQDKKSSQSQKLKSSSTIKNTENDIFQRDKSISQKSKSAIKTAEYLIAALYEKIKKVNPLSSKEQNTKQIQEKKLKLKQIQKLQKRQSVDQSTRKILINLFALSSKSIIKTMSQQEKQTFMSILYDSFENEMHKAHKEARLTKIEHIQQQLYIIIQEMQGNNQIQPFNQLVNHTELKWIVLLYKSLEKQYHTGSQRRKWLMKFCQNQYINKRLQNPFSVIKMLQNEKMQQSIILKALRDLPVVERFNPQNKIQIINKKIQAHMVLQHELNRIHLFEMKKKYAKQPCLEFQKLTNNKSRVITFLFSGFLSQDTCKVKQWSGMLQNFYDSEVYAIKWQSKTVDNMIEFAYKSVLELGPTQSIAMLGGPYIRAFAILHNLYQKFQQNPFNPAFEAATITGEFLAEFFMQNFKGYFINLVGFSLGTQLIKNILIKMASKKSLNMINKVYFIGGVADTTQIQALIQQSPSSLTVTNLHSDKDYILKYLLRICKYGIKPIGLNPIKQIQGHRIINEDCTYFIQGHMGYRDQLQLISKLLKIADD